MSETRVARQGTPDAAGGVYIGRPSKFGNPYIIGRDGDRDEVIEKFRVYFTDRLGYDQAFRSEVEGLRGRTLVCFCAPEPCHGDVIAEYHRSREMEPCPGCGLELPADDLAAQAAHMDAQHPEIVAGRRAEAARWDGWEDA